MKTPAEALYGSVRASRHPHELVGALRTFYSATDAEVGSLIERKGVQLACRSGCTLCCYLRVHVRAHEIFVIVDYINHHFSDAEKAELIGRLEAHVSVVGRMSEIEHKTTNVICPLLVGGRCSVYSVRPFGCRSHHSLKFSDCEYSYNEPTDIVFNGAKSPDYLGVVGMMGTDAQAIFESLGFESRDFELGSALLSALREPSLMRRWKDKKKTELDGEVE